MKRRNDGQALVANEEVVLLVAMGLLVDGTKSFHGYGLSKAIDQANQSMAYTTVYRCLDRLEERGLLASEWEIAENSRRPRKVYSVTGAGVEAAQAIEDAPKNVVSWRLA